MGPSLPKEKREVVKCMIGLPIITRKNMNLRWCIITAWADLNASNFVADVYNINSNKGTVGKFSLFKSAYRIGEEIVGNFDFSESLIPCYKVGNTSSLQYLTEWGILISGCLLFLIIIS